MVTRGKADALMPPNYRRASSTDVIWRWRRGDFAVHIGKGQTAAKFEGKEEEESKVHLVRFLSLSITFSFSLLYNDPPFPAIFQLVPQSFTQHARSLQCSFC